MDNPFRRKLEQELLRIMDEAELTPIERALFLSGVLRELNPGKTVEIETAGDGKYSIGVKP